MSDEKIKMWFEIQRGDEDAKGIEFKFDSDATEDEIRAAFRAAENSVMMVIAGRDLYIDAQSSTGEAALIPPAVKVSL